jgi:hypothetical protein
VKGEEAAKVNENKTSMWQDVWGVNGAQGMQQWSGKDLRKGSSTQYRAYTRQQYLML